MSSDVFIISTSRSSQATAAIREAVAQGGVPSGRIQDAIFASQASSFLTDLDRITRDAGLTCAAVGVSSGLRALAFASTSILGDDANLIVVIGMEADQVTAILLASAEAVGLLNLLPQGRVAARSLAGSGPALQAAGLAANDVSLCKEGDDLSLLHDLLAEVESQSGRWGMISSPDITILVERI